MGENRATKLPIYPWHPERICRESGKYRSTQGIACGNGTSRTQHSVEILAKIA
ncbi:DUF3079 domain-containing protein [Chromobacterium piscinae]|uniref:DUF3079 domain-containing protein n=1 Tax=Chromobacterium piscinae TaxID=686831 RepID=UPI003F81A8A4